MKIERKIKLRRKGKIEAQQKHVELMIENIQNQVVVESNVNAAHPVVVVGNGNERLMENTWFHQ